MVDTLYRYAVQYRPLTQLPLNKLGFVVGSDRKDPRFPFGTACFSRRLIEFEVSQLDLVFIGEESVT